MRWLRTAAIAAALAAVTPALAQPANPQAEWRKVGNSLRLLGLPSAAGGPVERVWFGLEGRLTVRLAGGNTYTTQDLETWQPAGLQPPEPSTPPPAGARAPESGARMQAARSGSATVYASGKHAWRSEDGGLNWRNLTQFRGGSLLGGPLLDLAVDPASEQRIAAATAAGVWLSVDAGLSWQGANEGLPNLAVRRILAAPAGARGVRIGVEEAAGIGEYEWLPGQRQGWMPAGRSILPAERSILDDETALKRALSTTLGARVTAVAVSGDSLYAGASDGRLWASLDAGASWRPYAAAPGSGAVERIWLDPGDRGFALAALASAGPGAPRVLRTLNAGTYWDDLSANLPDGPAYGIAADRSTGAIYLAAAQGVYMTLADLRAPAQATPWAPIGAALPEAPVRDVRLDAAGNLLLAAVEGHGVYSTLAPHRHRQPRVVHTLDYSPRGAAPGALLSVLGASVTSAAANSASAVVLASSPAESQIQIPFGVAGDTLQLEVNAAQGRVVFGLPLKSVEPAILIDRDDGAPMLMDADSGVQLDAMNPARGGMRVQVLMSGLGRVQPGWPTGLAAPLKDSPRVTAPLRALLDGAPVEVLRATLAPGLIGYYLVEVQLPEFLDAGSSEFVVEAAGRASNPVRVYVGQ
ncbi:MAG: hypothetical protein HY858_08575 [Candidatus Solibacter usitatus]|nr:hypothetical protein [Candidatus Solibacter usitatus]